MNKQRRVSRQLKPHGLAFHGNQLFGYSSLPSGTKIIGKLIKPNLPRVLTSNSLLVKELNGALASEGRFLKYLPTEVREEFGRLTRFKDRFDFLIRNRAGQIGVRKMWYNAATGTLSCSVCVVPHPVYKILSLNLNPRLSRIGSNLGSCVVLLTTEADGSSMLVLQGRGEFDPTRKRGNELYGGTVGAAAAGLVSAQRISVSGYTDVELASWRNVLEEWLEELGSDAEVVTCVGLAIDYRALHHELNYLSVSKHSFDTLKRLALRSNAIDNPIAFRENFFAVPATPENFEKLLRIRVPIPPTHWANFVAAYENVLRSLGMEASQIERTIKEYVRQIGLSQERVDKLCRSGAYIPNQRADEQGLISVQEALDEVFGDQLKSAIVTDCR